MAPMRVRSSGPPVRIVVHDYAGHPFQLQLSRELASRGHRVLHLHSTAFQTPKATLVRQHDDPPALTIEGVDLREPFQKYNFIRRLMQERRYGRLVANRIASSGAEVLLSANVPLDALSISHAEARRQGMAAIVWLQDVYSIAIARALTARLPVIGRQFARRFERLEAAMLRSSDAVVSITEDFLPVLDRWRVPPERVSVIHNWAPLGDIRPLPKSNAWSTEQGLGDVPVLLYAGTLGLKHDPSLLALLAEEVPEATVVVVSDGLGAGWLRRNRPTRGNLVVLPFQPFNRLSEVLATADVLLVILEANAGEFSVPSKVLTSLAAGRAILAGVPGSNLAAKTIERARAGRVVDPADRAGFVAAAREMLGDAQQRQRWGEAARAYAESTFDITKIADRFEAVIRQAVQRRGANRPNRRFGGATTSGSTLDG
jgi:colanic acid biosynthesis glycosyl transferase WcaI